MTRRSSLAFCLGLLSCAPTIEQDPADSTDIGSESTTAGDVDLESTDSGEESTTGDSDESTSDSSDSTGPDDSEGPPTPADFEKVCLEQVDRTSCEAVPSEYYFGEGYWCAWWVEVPVTLVGDTCSFGVPQPRCAMNSAGESGCVGGDLCGSPNEQGWSRTEGEDLVIGRGEVCYDPDDDCSVDAEGVVGVGVPECACLCDPAFPL